MNNNTKSRKWAMIFCYIISLIPLFLPWCYFEKEVDGIKYGKDMVNSWGMIILVGITLLGLLVSKTKKQKRVVMVLLLFHPLMYLFYFLFWYVPLIANFNLILSIESAHLGIYLAILSSIIVFFVYVKGES